MAGFGSRGGFRFMRKRVWGTVAGAFVLASAVVTTVAQAQEWNGAGPMIAAFYNEEMSVPKGWELTFTGSQNGVEVYTFYVRPDTVDVDTSWIDAEGQLERALCGAFQCSDKAVHSTL